MLDRTKEVIGKTMLKIFGLRKSLEIYYRIKTKHKLHLDNPERYSERIQVRKLNYKENPLYVLCADKYKVRDYVKEKIGEEYLIPLYFAKKTITKEDLEELPNKFVLKTNNASKTNIIVKDKKTEDLDKIVQTMNKYVKYKFGYRTFELFYNEIEPYIIAEKYMGTPDMVPNDYKFFCFKQKDGKTKIIIQMDIGRYTNNHCRAYLTEDWQIEPYGNEMNEEDIDLFKKPKNLQKMLDISRKLSEDFDYVRVDLYEVGGKIYFGELTFTDGSGYDLLKPEKYDYEWRKYW